MRVVIESLLRLQTLILDDGPDAEGRARLVGGLRQKIPPEILKHFDSMANRGKKGIVAAVNNVCAGCHLQLSSGTLSGLRHHEDIGRCEHCGRYLHLTDAAGSLATSAAPFFMVPKAAPAPRKSRGRPKTAA